MKRMYTKEGSFALAYPLSRQRELGVVSLGKNSATPPAQRLTQYCRRSFAPQPVLGYADTAAKKGPPPGAAVAL